ncbi:MAG: hypothetical protein Q7T66_09505 [Herminiimonas sp.]|uniref:hypothetical protein n=1 Tax=Herminiimonas sp. TaxID=1926289 RepID=UPI002727C857|nr:hypothetical protein [Herminiimonas sp.]MDO9420885.1 hypothetical protein [Herminiimonas sp.]
MAIEALAEIVIRAVGYFILEIVIVKIFYWPGWLILRVITLGRYPPAYEQSHHREFVGILGLAAILISFLLTLPGG